MKIILGSQSKPRKKVLEEMGFEFETISPNIDEKAIRFEDPKELTLALAYAKAEAIKSRISEPAILITADQVVFWNNKIREKPQNENEAKEFLEGYNVAPAQTVSAVVVTNLITGKQVSRVDIATIYFAEPFTEQDIGEIIKEGTVFSHAGGFLIEGNMWERHIKSVEGTRDSVMGLPAKLTRKLLEEVIN